MRHSRSAGPERRDKSCEPACRVFPYVAALLCAMSGFPMTFAGLPLSALGNTRSPIVEFVGATTTARAEGVLPAGTQPTA